MKPRRWISYSLRTVFVLLTLVGIAIGWLSIQVKWVKDRRAAIHSYSFVRGHDGPATAKLPWQLQLCGEVPVVRLYAYSDEDFAKAKRLFPEAEVKKAPYLLR